MLLLVGNYVGARYIWTNAAPITVTPDNARAPYLASVSVLAIAIPLVANLTFEVSQTTQQFWVVGLLLGAMTFALVALVIGTMFVYKFSLPVGSRNIEITRSLAPWMSVQYSAMILFILTSFIGLACFIILDRTDSAPSEEVAQRFASAKLLPVLESGEPGTIESRGKVDVRDKTGRLSRTEDSILVFSLEDAILERVTLTKAKEDTDAVRMGC